MIGIIQISIQILIPLTFRYLRFMTKWILGIGVLVACFSCQPEIPTGKKEVSATTESGTVDYPKLDTAAVPLIFFLKELEIKGLKTFTIRDTVQFKSLPAGVYQVKADTILFGKLATEWISSGITRWPSTGRVALAELIISDQPLFYDQIGIFPQKPGNGGYLPGCFSCPGWMVEQHGALLVFWEKYLMDL